MKKIANEFKTFITRGNVVDMAVGVIIGGAFTGVVNGLSNFILKPIINWILAMVLGKDGLSGVITPLSMSQQIDANGELVWKLNSVGKIALDANGDKIPVWDLANSIYIDWGSFISAIINFLLIAVVLFTIVKVINTVRANHEKMTNLVINGKVTKEEKKEMKALGYDFRSDADIEVYRAQKKADADKAAAEAAEAAAIERANNPTTEDLLKDIRDLLKNK
ncbi:MAG: MscL family protein [Ruminococcaceae bacterium]|nr:MscL family protein [Oscillospiraceae bacterium]